MESKSKYLSPFSFTIDMDKAEISKPYKHIIRKLSSMEGQYNNKEAYQMMLKKEDILLYEVLEKETPEIEGELKQGLSIVYPGKVGKEYFMTMGHFHSSLKTAEIYYCMKGQGYMLMETPEGESQAKKLVPSTVVYVPGGWAHRSVNTGNDDLVTWFIYPANAGHDYKTIKNKGFKKLIIDNNNKPEIIDNPNWSRG